MLERSQQRACNMHSRLLSERVFPIDIRPPRSTSESATNSFSLTYTPVVSSGIINELRVLRTLLCCSVKCLSDAYMGGGGGGSGDGSGGCGTGAVLFTGYYWWQKLLLLQQQQ